MPVIITMIIVIMERSILDVINNITEPVIIKIIANTFSFFTEQMNQAEILQNSSWRQVVLLFFAYGERNVIVDPRVIVDEHNAEGVR